MSARLFKASSRDFSKSDCITESIIQCCISSVTPQALKRDAERRHISDLLAQLGRDDAANIGRTAQCFSRNNRARRAEQRFTHSHRKTANDNAFRIQYVDENRHGLAQSLSGCCDEVPCEMV